MKIDSFLCILSAFYCVGLISCKEQGNSYNRRHVFQESGLESAADDTVQAQYQFEIDQNVGSDTQRGVWQNPDLVILKLGDLSGKVVADIGSGTGYFTFPISRRAKKVLAIDIEQRYLDYIEDRKLEFPIEQAEVIETRLTVEDEPNLHKNEVDAVLLVNVFYYLKDRASYMKIVNNALKDEGILVLVDFKTGNLPVGPSENKVPADEVVEVLEISGFENIIVDLESLQYQYIITAKSTI